MAEGRSVSQFGANRAVPTTAQSNKEAMPQTSKVVCDSLRIASRPARSDRTAALSSAQNGPTSTSRSSPAARAISSGGVSTSPACAFTKNASVTFAGSSRASSNHSEEARLARLGDHPDSDQACVPTRPTPTVPMISRSGRGFC